MSFFMRFRINKIPRLSSFFIVFTLAALCLGLMPPSQAINKLTYRYEPANTAELLKNQMPFQ